mgnify:CR=1 FL=1
MTFKEILSYYQIRLFSEDGIALRKMNPAYYDESNCEIATLNEHSIFFVTEGELKIKVQGKTFLLTRNYYADIIDDLPVQLLGTSSDIRAYHLVLSEDFLFTLFKSRPPFPVSYILEKKTNPLFKIEEKSSNLISRCLEDIGQTLENQSHCFRKEMLQCKTRVFFMEIANLFLQAQNKTDTTETNRKRMLFTHFVKMLPEHVRKEHTVNYYASRLCVTPQYLGRIVQEFSGKTVYRWISETLVRDIIQLLMDTDMTIQEIANELNFSDQAVLSKMFKRHQGVSPLKFRNENK